MSKSVPLDKRLHFIAGLKAFAFGLMMSVTLLFGFPKLNPILIGLAAAFLVGLLKEIWDLCSNVIRLRSGLPPKHKVEVMDVVWTFAGGLFGAALIIFFDWAFGPLDLGV